MNATLPAPDLRLLAPVFAGRCAVIVASLAALIARAFLRQPTLAPLIIPLCRRLSRTARHLTALMTRRAAKRSGANSGSGAAAPRERSRTPRSPIPRTEAWLIHTLGYEAAGYASQLSHLLAEPGVSDLLDATPAARRLLNPLCRMLGLPTTAPRAVVGSSDPAAGTCDATPQPPAPPPDQDCARPTLIFPPPPCPHAGWPWFPRHAAMRSGAESDRGAPLPATATPRERPRPAAKRT